MNALLLGSTGLVGRHCLDYLLNSPNFELVLAPVRTKSGLNHSHLTEIPLNDGEFAIPGPAVEFSHVFCAFGTTIKKAGSQEMMRHIDVDIPLRVAKRSLELGSKHFSLVSSLGANSSSRIFYNRIKGELEDSVSGMGFESVDIFRPSVIGGDRRNEERFMEKLGQRAMSLLPLAWRTIPASRIAAAMISRGSDPQSGVRVFESKEIWSV